MEKCAENIEETRLVEKISVKNENKQKCSCCTLYIVLFSIIFKINIGIGIYFVHSHCYLQNYGSSVMLDTRTEATIY